MCLLFLSDFNRTCTCQTYFLQNALEHKISQKSVQQETSCSMWGGWKDRQTDRHEKANSYFSQLC